MPNAVMLPTSDRRAARQVRDCGEILKRLHFLAKEAVRGLAGWIVGVRRWEPKTVMPKHLWWLAEHANSLRSRVLELRFPNREMIPGPDAPLISAFAQISDAPDEDCYIC